MRSVPEWIGKSDDTPVPPRIKARVALKFEGRCAVCKHKLGGKRGCEIDHELSIGNGGENRESNLRPLCVECHKPKTAEDRKKQAKADRITKRRLGIKPKGRGWQSKFKKKVNGQTVWRDTEEPVCRK